MAKPTAAHLIMGYGGPDTDDLPGRAVIIDRTTTFLARGRGWKDQESEYRAAGYTGLILTYQLFLQIQRAVHPTLGWNHNQWVTSQAEYNALPDDAFLRKGSATGPRIEYSPGTYGTSTNILFVWIDPKHPAVKTWMRDRAQALLGKYGQHIDGIFLDNVSFGLKQVKDDAGGQGVYSAYTGELYTETTWSQANADLCAFLRTNTSHPLGKAWALVGNLIHQNSSTDWIKYAGLDGLFDEGMAGYPGLGYPGGSHWSASRIKHVIQQARAFLNLSPSKFILLYGESEDTAADGDTYQNDVSELRMTFAQYLMIRPVTNTLTLNGHTTGRASYRFTHYNKYGEFWDSALFDSALDDPVSDPLEEQPGLWRRNYKNGYVRANFNNTVTGGLAARDGEIVITGGTSTPPPATTPSVRATLGAPKIQSGVTSITLDHPTDTVANKPLVAFIGHRSFNGDIETTITQIPANWTRIGSPTRRDYDFVEHLFVYPNPPAGIGSGTWNFEASTSAAGRIIQLDNVGTNLAQWVVLSQINATDSDVATTPNINVLSNTLFLAFVLVPGASQSFTFSGGLTELYEVTNPSIGVSLAAGAEVRSTAGLVGSRTIALTNYALKSGTFALGVPGLGPVPSKPVIVSITARNRRIDLVWTAASGATKYTVKRATVSGGPYTTLNANVVATNYSDSGLANNIPYFYTITPENENGVGAPSDEASAIPDLPVPTNLRARTQGLVTIVTETNVVADASGYIYSRSASEDGPWTDSPVQVLPSYTWTPLSGGERYYFKARAVEAGGDSSNDTNLVSRVAASGKTWYAGDSLFNTGRYDSVTGKGSGFIDLYSMRSIKAENQAGPTIAMNVRTGNGHADYAEHTGLGNLAGLYDYDSDVYGLAAGRYSPEHSWFAADPINGIRIMRGDEPVFHVENDGTVTIGNAGNIVLNPDGTARFTTAGNAIQITETGLLLTQGDAAYNKIRWGNAAGASTYDYGMLYATATNGTGRLFAQARNTGQFKASSVRVETYADAGAISGFLNSYIELYGTYYSGTSGSVHTDYAELNASDIYLNPRSNETNRNHGVGIGYLAGEVIDHTLKVNGNASIGDTLKVRGTRVEVGTASSVEGSLTLYPSNANSWFHLQNDSANNRIRFSTGSTVGATTIATISSGGNLNIIGQYFVNGTRVLTSRQPNIASPTGGTTIDTQARATLASVLSLLQTHGLMT